jgi:hypothetical protein
MGERILRPGIRTSDRTAALVRDGGWMAQVFYDWLLTVVDDHGRFDGRPSILRVEVFPLLLDMVREADVQRCLAACEKAGLIRLWADDGKQFLELLNFRQRRRSRKSRWPDPPGGPSGPPQDVPTVSGQCHDNAPTMPTVTSGPSPQGSPSDVSPPHPLFLTSPSYPPPAQRSAGPEEAADGDPLDAQVRQFLNAHPMLIWNPKDHATIRKVVESKGWDWTNRMIQQAVERAEKSLIGYLIGCWRRDSLVANRPTQPKPPGRSAAWDREDN